MAVGGGECQGKGMTGQDKQARLAAALRDNLRKRKAAGNVLVVPAKHVLSNAAGSVEGGGTSGDDEPKRDER